MENQFDIWFKRVMKENQDLKKTNPLDITLIDEV